MALRVGAGDFAGQRVAERGRKQLRRRSRQLAERIVGKVGDSSVGILDGSQFVGRMVVAVVGRAVEAVDAGEELVRCVVVIGRDCALRCRQRSEQPGRVVGKRDGLRAGSERDQPTRAVVTEVDAIALRIGVERQLAVGAVGVGFAVDRGDGVRCVADRGQRRAVVGCEEPAARVQHETLRLFADRHEPGVSVAVDRERRLIRHRPPAAEHAAAEAPADRGVIVPPEVQAAAVGERY